MKPEQIALSPEVARGAAEFSGDGKYRYTLDRWWDETLPRCLFIMLNPSTATAETDDPTTRRCLAFARRLNCGRYRAVNLFAWRSSKPTNLLRVAEPVGPENDVTIRASVRSAGPVVVAWGTAGMWKGREAEVMSILHAEHCYPLCLGLTENGSPRHPLYVRADVEMMEYPTGFHRGEIDGTAT